MFSNLFYRPGLKKTAWFLTLALSITWIINCNCQAKKELSFFGADNPFIQYMGRIDFSNPQLPRFWQPGVYITVSFEGPACEVILNDEVLWGEKHNYLELVLDKKETRIQTKSARDTLRLVSPEGDGIHHLTIYKNTEANIGYLELVGIRCEKLVPSPPPPQRKMEFIGNSITCAASSDESAIPCGTRNWEDQHNAYLGYGSVAARSLNASFYLSAVSGIGLVHSCCDLDILMPQVFDKVSMRDNKIAWDFNKYQPDVVTICLGQNDGIQDSVLFCGKYEQFIHTIRLYYPRATIICMNSPMADERLDSVLKKYITGVVKAANATDSNVYSFFFSKRYFHGCDTHPNIEEHGQMAAELVSFVRKMLKW